LSVGAVKRTPDEESITPSFFTRIASAIKNEHAPGDDKEAECEKRESQTSASAMFAKFSSLTASAIPKNSDKGQPEATMMKPPAVNTIKEPATPAAAVKNVPISSGWQPPRAKWDSKVPAPRKPETETPEAAAASKKEIGTVVVQEEEDEDYDWEASLARICAEYLENPSSVGGDSDAGSRSSLDSLVLDDDVVVGGGGGGASSTLKGLWASASAAVHRGGAASKLDSDDAEANPAALAVAAAAKGALTTPRRVRLPGMLGRDTCDTPSACVFACVGRQLPMTGAATILCEAYGQDGIYFSNIDII